MATMNNNCTEKEIWKDIKLTEYATARYAVSNLGRVKNKRTGNIFRPHPRNRKMKYPAVSLQIEPGVQKTFFVHRLVAVEFLPNPENLPEVNHKDQNKQNPRLDNLEWCSRKYNINYGDCIERIVAGQMDHPPEFLCLENGKIYRNQCQAARELGVFQENINMVLNGKRNHTGGYHFVWLYKLEAEP